MSVRSSSFRVIFLHPFSLADFPDELPAADYEVLIQEEILAGKVSKRIRGRRPI
jgi:hypothetical protein